MLNMKLLDYRITSDADNVTVRRVVRNEKGEVLYDKKGKKELPSSVTKEILLKHCT